MHGEDGNVDYMIGGSLYDTIFADESVSTNSSNLDTVFGDHAEMVFYWNESHKLQQAVTTDAGCNGGSALITLGPGDDWVSLLPVPCLVSNF